MALAVTPPGPNSWATALVNATTPALDAAYAGWPSPGRQGGDRRHVDDAAPAALGHRRHGDPHRVEHAGYPAPAGEPWVPARLGGGAPDLATAKQIEEAEFAERRARGDHV